MKIKLSLHLLTVLVASLCLLHTTVINNWDPKKWEEKIVQQETEDKNQTDETNQQVYFLYSSHLIQSFNLQFFNSVQQIITNSFPRINHYSVGITHKSELPVSQILEVLCESTAAPNAP